jgi:hypothetical protein
MAPKSMDIVCIVDSSVARNSARLQFETNHHRCDFLAGAA